MSAELPATPDDVRTLEALRAAAVAVKAGNAEVALRHVNVAVALISLWAADERFGKREGKR